MKHVFSTAFRGEGAKKGSVVRVNFISTHQGETASIGGSHKRLCDRAVSVQSFLPSDLWMRSS